MIRKLEKKVFSNLLLAMFLIGMLASAFNIQPVKASGTIYIKADGSIEGTDKIQRLGDTYTFTDDIYDSIVVQKSNIIIDGVGYTLQGTGLFGIGFLISDRSNVTIKNTNIKGFDYGVKIESCSYVILSKNNMANNYGQGVQLKTSTHNTLSDNYIVGNGISLWDSSFNTVSHSNLSDGYLGIELFWNSNFNNISNNNIENKNWHGVYFKQSFRNNVYGNNLTKNSKGIDLSWFSNHNKFYHNNLVENKKQAVLSDSYDNIWDDGYPSGGNYWSDYVERYPDAEELDGSGIWDMPYIIDANNQDNYPLVNPWTPTPPAITAIVDIDPDTLNLRSKGEWITAYIELQENYNVSDIDRTTTLLNGTITVDPFWVDKPLESVIGDYDNDGVLDLMVKFNRTAVSELILSKGIKYGNVTLTITGQLYDGTLFEGSDIIVVRMPGDVNSDGKVHIVDVALVAVRYGQSNPDPYYDINEDGKIDILDIATAAINYGKTYA